MEQKRFFGKFEDKSDEPIKTKRDTRFLSKEGKAKMDSMLYQYLSERQNRRTAIDDIRQHLGLRNPSAIYKSIKRLTGRGEISIDKSRGVKGGYYYTCHGKVRSVPSMNIPRVSDNPILRAKMKATAEEEAEVRRKAEEEALMKVADEPVEFDDPEGNALQREYLEYLYMRYHSESTWQYFLNIHYANLMYKEVGLDKLDKKLGLIKKARGLNIEEGIQDGGY